MEISEEIQLLKRAIEAHQVCINDIHNRLNSIVTLNDVDSSKQHIFHSRDSKGIYLIKCCKTGGSFSSQLWRLERVPRNTCPCCGEIIQRFEK
jgi:hypothetical protein